MTTTHGQRAASAVPRSACAGAFIDSLAVQDFARLAAALTTDARLRALLPQGPREWTGAEAIAGLFGHWFGLTEDFELVAATADEISGRLHLCWRLRLRAERLGAGWFIVEQQAYADPGEDGRIARLDLLCTGYRPEGDHG
jgi:hypothetical protein